jgi:DNA invertase Pin-like site-specific DNA recombinase
VPAVSFQADHGCVKSAECSPDTALPVLGYVRVSTDEQSTSGAGLEAQRQVIVAECERRGWHLVHVIEDAGFSAKDLKRPGVQEALRALKTGDAAALVVAKLDRLSRSMIDFTGVMATAQKQGWALVALDCAVDTTTPAGEAMANVLATFAQFERRLISQRTREALVVKKQQGVRLGRPSSVPLPVERRICRARATGSSYQTIADRLNRDGVPTAHGGAKWYAATVRHVALRRERDARAGAATGPRKEELSLAGAG